MRREGARSLTGCKDRPHSGWNGQGLAVAAARGVAVPRPSATSHISRGSKLSAANIVKASQLHTGTTLDLTIWTLAGGYTVLQGGWGNLDVIAGLRLLAVNATVRNLRGRSRPVSGTRPAGWLSRPPTVTCRSSREATLSCGVGH
jgi:hypothetical protein